MIVTYNWLKEFVDFDLAPEELADHLTMLGLEVERMEHRFAGMDDVVVALVQEKAQHPNADKLSLCKVNNGSDILTIVCGAQNFKEGDKVVLAQIGSVLPGDFRIKKSKIRGEESFGMLCSEKELGLAEESAGIMILPPHLPLGVPLFDALGLKDTVFEIGLTPNRADCLSVIGVAREVAAKLGKKVKYSGHQVSEKGSSIKEKASVVIEDPELCPRYTARFISGCNIGPSPQWLVSRLQSVGMRSINNVVDVTNFVLMEYGHPLHAFDFDLLSGGKIVVKRAAQNQTFTTLDGQDRVLQTSDLTICDDQKPVALAGIMGGGNSEIGNETRNILLESAYFAPSFIRKTSKRLGLHTESSHRFERGTDVNILTKALDRAASLIADLADGEVASGVIDVYPEKIHPRKVQLRLSRVNSLLGLALSAEEIIRLLEQLEFEVEILEPGVCSVAAPSFRVDIEREIDLIEEIARLNGYEKIPVTMPVARVFSDRTPRRQRLEAKVRNVLVGQGFNEVINFSFIAPNALDKLSIPENDPCRDVVKLLNPLAEEQSVMRTSLLPGLLETALRNFSFRTMNLRIFELRRVYLPKPDRELPDEPLMIAGLLAGRREPEGWNQEKAEVDFYDAKGVVEYILASLGVSGAGFVASSVPAYFHPGKSCVIMNRDEQIGALGELHPTVLENYDVEKSLYYFELNFEKTIASIDEAASIVAPPKFPDTFRDIAMLIDEELPAMEIVNCIKGMKIKEVENVDIFDFYKGEHIPKGQKSIAVRVRYRSNEKTLTDEEVTRIHNSVIQKLTKILNVSIR